jgi:tetratricopeptide (TPR) repeat protein
MAAFLCPALFVRKGHIRPGEQRLWLLLVMLALPLAASSIAQAPATAPPTATLDSYRKACDGGDAKVCMGLGLAYFSGSSGLTKSLPDAAAMFNKACDGGIATACSNLGMMFGSGEGVERNGPQAIAFYQKACDLKDPHSCYLLCTGGFLAACRDNYGPFDEEMRTAAEAFTSGRLPEAITHLKAAIALKPADPQAHFYLACLYGYQVVPNSMTGQNIATAHQAIDELHTVLQLKPEDGLALRMLATLHRNIQEYDKAEEDLQRILKTTPGDYEAEYTLGYIDWSRAYKTVADGLLAEHLTYTEDAFARASPALCKSIAAKDLPLLEESDRHLKKAVALHPDYRDALIVQSLLDRLRADSHCGDAANRVIDLTNAGQLQAKAAALPANAKSTSPQPPSTLQPLSPNVMDVLTALPTPPPPPEAPGKPGAAPAKTAPQKAPQP